MPQGTVRWFDADRGFGFIDLGNDADDLFVHASEIVGDDGPKQLREGQAVEFELGQGDRGPEILEEGDRVRYKVRQSDRGPQADSVELL